ncbi:type VI secretion system baseplate subunit TssF [Aquincola sp. S2]|uniref:Type VI secretion system baseplate subunit TssF n=1 Tax=Pseudaquabacterium terrae TaxID=2732868 RepID=A0ABX2ELA6_9BURK|nr:type VI secretion system baseplate subunit TssF [Aquabacterium terrae]NRF69439.1 type VI secretion system baseplate subunit TssF [Aquabacterium terrae]
MRDLLPHFQRELNFLQTHKSEFAAAYPEVGGRLAAASDLLDDPHVERLMQSFALLTARVHKRLDDDFPLVTESLLEVLYPHYLRPFPSCSIACFDLGAGAAQLSKPVQVPRGTLLDSRPVRGVKCRFRSAYEVTLLPLRVVDAGFRGAINAPAGTLLPREATTEFFVTLELQSPQLDWATLGASTLRVALQGETSMVHALREALTGQVLATLVQADAPGAWTALPGGQQGALPRIVGFADDEALVDHDPRSHPAYRLLTEYFAFPAKFNFLDLPLPTGAACPKTRRLTLHFPMAGLRTDGEAARQLELATAAALVPGCTPVVNLFEQRADPIRITHTGTTYPVLPDGGRRAYGYEVHSIQRVFRVQQTPQGESIHAFHPFYSLRHEQLLREGEQAGRYWYSQRSDSLAERSPGYETEIGIVDIEFDPAEPQTDTLSIDVLATNRDLPSQLTIGHGGGDLFVEGGSVAREIRLLRVPTTSHRFERGEGALWRLVSHLSLNHLSIGGAGVQALQEMLRLYDLPRSATNARLVDGLIDISYQPTSACLPGNPFPTFVRGVLVRLTVDADAYGGHGLRLFAQVLDHFFGLYVQANSFSQLEVVSAQTRERLLLFPRRAGAGPLL